MNTTVNALKNLYSAMGGESEAVENVNLIPDMINELCNVAGGGGGGLPDFLAGYNTVEFVDNGEMFHTVTFSPQRKTNSMAYAFIEAKDGTTAMMISNGTDTALTDNDNLIAQEANPNTQTWRLIVTAEDFGGSAKGTVYYLPID